MPVTQQEARAIAFLAHNRRATLHGATNWDEAGIIAALAKVAQLDLADVTMAAMRAAADRTLETPGAIGNPSSPCWRERVQAETGAPRRDFDRGTHCGTCSEPEDRCRARWADDHEFEPIGRALAAAAPIPDNVRELIPARETRRDRAPYLPEHATPEREEGPA